jgi:hypothetical protein
MSWRACCNLINAHLVKLDMHRHRGGTFVQQLAEWAHVNLHMLSHSSDGWSPDFFISNASLLLLLPLHVRGHAVVVMLLPLHVRCNPIIERMHACCTIILCWTGIGGEHLRSHSCCSTRSCNLHPIERLSKDSLALRLHFAILFAFAGVLCVNGVCMGLLGCREPFNSYLHCRTYEYYYRATATSCLFEMLP